jgi:hypothetical protein
VNDKSDVPETFINLARTQELLRQASNANAELENIYRWLMENVVGADVYPRYLPNDVNERLVQARTHLEAVESSLSDLVNKEQRFFVSVLGKTQRNEKLTPAEYYICRAFGFISGIDEKDSEYEKYLVDK